MPSTGTIRRNVLVGAQVSLQQITQANGYLTTLSRVEVADRLPDNPNFPMAMLHEVAGSTVERLTHRPPVWEHRVRFRVHALAHGRGEGGREGALADVIDDIMRRLLHDDPQLGGACKIVHQAEPDETDEGIARPMGTAALDFVARQVAAPEALMATYHVERLGVVLTANVETLVIGPVELLAYPNWVITLANRGSNPITDGWVQATAAGATAPDGEWETTDTQAFANLAGGAVRSHKASSAAYQYVRLKLRSTQGTIVDAYITANS